MHLKKGALLTCALFFLFLGIRFWVNRSDHTEAERIAPPAAPLSPPAPDEPLIGDTILRDYGSEAHPPQHDLELLDRVFLSYRTLVKNHATKPVGENTDFANVLLGDNPHRHVFLSRTHPALNSEGQLIDRWRTPLFIHPIAAGQLEIRSAGPDGRMWTDDDIQRNPDGRFE